jgi:type I restriction enzyme S subunit
MNADRLLALFEPISEAPDAIPRLRRFILDLAVRGKLVEQDAEDEPAEELLREMESRFKRLKITKKQVLLEAKEIPFALPDRWQWTRLGQICEKTGSGSTPRGGKEAYSETGIPFLRSQNVYNDGLRLADVVFIDHQIHQRMAATTVLPCDLLLNITGGSIGRCAKVPVDFQEANVSQHVAIIRVGMPGMEDFIHAFILSPYFQSFVDKSQTGAGRGGLPKNRMDAIPVALPPLAEQHRIVAKVDELMALCDRLEAARQQREQCRERLVAASLQRLNQASEFPDAFRIDARFALQVLPSLTSTPAQVKQLRQTILNLAVRGKLVEQDPEAEPADVRLVQIQRALSSTIASMGLRLKRSSSSPAASPEGDFAGVPSSWGLSTLGSLAIVLDPNPSHRYPSYDGGTVPILSTQEFNELDGWNPSTAKLVPLSFFEYQQANCRFEQGDIVFARKGRLGLPRFLPDLKQFTFSHTVFLVKPMPGISPEYLLWLLRRDQVITWLTNEMNANTGVPTLGKEKMERLPIPLPPLAEQHRIVAKVDELMALCDQLEQQLSQAEQSRRGLLEAVLQEALAAPSALLKVA